MIINWIKTSYKPFNQGS